MLQKLFAEEMTAGEYRDERLQTCRSIDQPGCDVGVARFEGVQITRSRLRIRGCGDQNFAGAVLRLRSFRRTGHESEANKLSPLLYRYPRPRLKWLMRQRLRANGEICHQW